jgi:hypothetical protein
MGIILSPFTADTVTARLLLTWERTAGFADIGRS